MRKSYSENPFLYHVKKSKYIIIYGAGMVGELTCKRLLAHGLNEKIIGFAVSKKGKGSGEDNRLCGLEIYEITELERYKRDALVIVATLPNVQEEIKKNLLHLQFEKIAFVGRKLYKSFEKHYVREFLKKTPPAFSMAAKNRILFMASDNNRTSGAFLCMVELCSMLLERGIAVLVVLPKCGTGETLLIQRGIPYTFILSKDWAYEIAKNNNYLERLSFAAGLLLNHRAKRKLIYLMKGQAVSLVHCNTTYTYIGAAAAKKCGIPFVWHLRENLENQGYRIFAFPRAFKLLQKAGKVIAVSDYIRDLMPFQEKSLVTTIYDAVETDTDVCREHEIFGQEIIRMIQVGLIAPFKGQRELIEACKILKSKNIVNFHLLVVGKGMGNYAAELQEVVKSYDLNKNITFFGVSDNVYELYAKSDISFMCGEKEAYGRVTIESQLSGCLMIGVNAGGTSELIKDGVNGYLYEAGNPQDLAEKMIAAIKNPEASRKIARAGQEYAYKTYTKERNFRQIADVYEEVLGTKI